MTAIIQNGTDLFGVAKWIVDPTSGSGTQTTIAAALTAASSGDTIFIRPGTYTENPTLKAGVDLVAFPGDGNTGNVIIAGNCTLSTAGTVSISGIQLQTNSANCVTVSGSAASILNLINCNINCTNNTGISFTTSAALTANINLYNCTGNLGTTGIALFSHSAGSLLNFYGCQFTNTGGSSTANTCSSAGVNFYSTVMSNPTTTSSTGGINGYNSVFDTSAQNATAITAGGSNNGNINNSRISAGSASAVSVGATLNMSGCTIVSSNTNAITGAGTLNYSALSFAGSSVKINTTTAVGGLLQGGVTQAPTAGFIGEQIRSFIASGSAIGVSNGVPANMTNISLTAGIWDVTAISIISCSGTATLQGLSINTTSATVGTNGDNYIFFSTGSVVSVSVNGLTLPSYRLTLTTTTTVYCVVTANFSSGTASAYGRISATRVG